MSEEHAEYLVNIKHKQQPDFYCDNCGKISHRRTKLPFLIKIIAVLFARKSIKKPLFGCRYCKSIKIYALTKK